MDKITNEDFKVKSLGNCTIKSPLKLSNTGDDNIIQLCS